MKVVPIRFNLMGYPPMHVGWSLTPAIRRMAIPIPQTQPSLRVAVAGGNLGGQKGGTWGKGQR